MSLSVLLRPGRVSVAEWRAIYRGTPTALDPITRADVEAGAIALRSAEAVAPSRAATGRAAPTISELLQPGGDPLPAGIVRLLMALKLGVLGQGVSGVSWPMVEALAGCLSRGLLPAIPAHQVSDRLALAHLFGLIAGAGEVLGDNRRRPAAKALKKAGLSPSKLNDREKQVLLAGSTLSVAFALAGLFEAERVFQSALWAGAMSAAAGRLPGAVLHPRVHKLARQPGQQEVAHALRALLAHEDGAPAPGAASQPEERETRRFAAQMGACLDLLRQAANTLGRTANAAAEERVVLWQTGEVVEGLDDTSALTFAADQVALALRQLGALAERRIGTLLEDVGAGANGTAVEIMAAGFSREIHNRACPSGFAPEAESDYPLVSAPAAARLLRVAGATSLVVIIELLAAARACDHIQPSPGGEALRRVRDLLRDAAPPSEESGVSAADLTGAAELIRSGALIDVVAMDLPALAPS